MDTSRRPTPVWHLFLTPRGGMAITRVAANAIDVVLAFGRFSRKLDTPTVTEPIPTGCFLKKSKQPIQAWRLTQNFRSNPRLSISRNHPRDSAFARKSSLRPPQSMEVVNCADTPSSPLQREIQSIDFAEYSAFIVRAVLCKSSEPPSR